jgi:hypothetical protein
MFSYERGSNGNVSRDAGTDSAWAVDITAGAVRKNKMAGSIVNLIFIRNWRFIFILVSIDLLFVKII